MNSGLSAKFNLLIFFNLKEMAATNKKRLQIYSFSPILWHAEKRSVIQSEVHGQGSGTFLVVAIPKKNYPCLQILWHAKKKPDIGSKVQGNGTFFGCRNFKVHLFSIGCLSGEKVAGIADKENG